VVDKQPCTEKNNLLVFHGSKVVYHFINENVQKELFILIIITKDFYKSKTIFKILFINMKENIQGVNYT